VGIGPRLNPDGGGCVEETHTGTEFALMMACIVTWNVLSAVEATVAAPGIKILASKLGYLGIVGVAPFYLLFARAYSRREARPGLGRRFGLWAIPTLTLLLVFTNEWHHLVWTAIVNPLDLGGEPLYRHGPWFWVWTAYSAIVSLIAMMVLVPATLHYRRLYLWQTVVLLAGTLLPWVGVLFYVSGFSPFPGLDTPTIGFGAMGVLVLLGMRRLSLLDVVPVARSVLIERMSEGVIVLDAEDRVVDTNPAAQALLQAPTDGVGRPAAEVFPALISALRGVAGGGRERHVNINLAGVVPLSLDLVITELRTRTGVLTGRLVVLRDVSVRERLIDELRTALETVKTLHGLLPICASCKKIRDDDGRWHTLESYIQGHSEARFSHGLCKECAEKLYPDLVEDAG